LIAIYVDNIIIASADLNKIKRFKIKDLGEIKYCLAIEFSKGHDNITISQKGYIKSLIKRFNMTDANVTSWKFPLYSTAQFFHEERELKESGE